MSEDTVLRLAVSLARARVRQARLYPFFELATFDQGKGANNAVRAGKFPAIRVISKISINGNNLPSPALSQGRVLKGIFHAYGALP